MCGGDLLAQPPLDLDHSDSGLFRRYEELGTDARNFEAVDPDARDRRKDLYNDIQRELQDNLETWNLISCTTQSVDIQELLEVGEEWQTKPSPELPSDYEFNFLNPCGPNCFGICLPWIGCINIIVPPVG